MIDHLTSISFFGKQFNLFNQETMTLNSAISGNFSQIVFRDELENLTSSKWLKASYCLVFCISGIVSFLSYSGFIYFEHYGEDPMKRSIKVNHIFKDKHTFFVCFFFEDYTPFINIDLLE